MKNPDSIFGVINKKRIHNLDDFQVSKQSNSGSYADEAHLLVLNSNGRFYEENFLESNPKFLMIADGVLLNLDTLLIENNAKDYFELCALLSEKGDSTFFKYFKGNFSGYFFDKQNMTGTLFTNHFGDKRIYYYENNEQFIFASTVLDIVNYLKKHNLPYDLDEAGAYCLLTYGYMYHNLTLVKQIKKLLPGQYLTIDSSGITQQHFYYKLPIASNVKEDDSILVEEINRLFTIATRLQVSKNERYSYRHVCPLSAGLDSRITTYAVSRLIDDNDTLLNMTYSETFELDQIIPFKISKDIKSHLLFKAQDNGLFLKDIVAGAEIGDGIQYYPWPAQLTDYTNLLDKKSVGIIHTGVLGDAILGASFNTRNNDKAVFGDGAYSRKLLNKLSPLITEVEYPNREHGFFYNRGFNGATLGYSTAFQKFTEAYSPFMDIDFFNFCLSLPKELRKNHNLYYKWINKYYPEACKFKFNGMKIPKKPSFRLKYKGKSYPIETIPSLLINVINSKAGVYRGMNPMDFWYNTNKQMKEHLDNFYNSHISCLDGYDELKKDAIMLYNNGTTQEKTLVISLLGSVVRFFR
jgi:asparagine synthase (glutamine-hydrolysing)